MSDSSDSLISPVWKGPHLIAFIFSVKINVLYYSCIIKVSQKLLEKNWLICLFKDYFIDSS